MKSIDDASSSTATLRSIILALGGGMFFLGVLIGTLLAMSAQSLAKGVIAALFALFGGSLVAFMQKLSANDQLKASIGLLTISLGTMAGIYTGLYVNEHQLLTPMDRRSGSSLSAASSPFCDPKYIRANIMTPSDAIDQLYRTKQLSEKEAYEQLHDLVEKNGR